MRSARFFILAIFFLALGLFYSHPLGLHLKDTIPYTIHPAKELQIGQFVEGDPLQLFYNLWLLKDFTRHPQQDFFVDHYQFQVPDLPRLYSTRELPLSLVFLPFSLILGDLFAYNLTFLLSFVFCGLAIYYLAERYLNNWAGSLVAACIFTCIPYRLLQLFSGHPFGFIVFWIPLIILLYEVYWDTRKILWAVLSCLSGLGLAMGSPHLVYYLALFSLVFFSYKAAKDLKSRKLDLPAALKLVSPLFLGWLIIASYMIFLNHMAIKPSVMGSNKGVIEIGNYAPWIKDTLTRKNFNAERNIYLGWVAVILLLAGTAWQILNHWRKKQPATTKMPRLFLWLIFLVTLVLAWGPYSRFGLIYKLFSWLPFFSVQRTPGRIIVFSHLALALLVGYALTNLISKIKNKKLVIFIVLIVVAALLRDYKTYHSVGLSTPPQSNLVYQYVKNTFPKNPILNISLWPGDSSTGSIYQYYTTLYGMPMINGYHPLVLKGYLEKYYFPLESLNTGYLSENGYQILKRIGTKYILLHREVYPPRVNPFSFAHALNILSGSPYVRFVMSDGPVFLFRVMEKPSSLPRQIFSSPAKTGVFFEGEYLLLKKADRLVDPEASGEKTGHISACLDYPIPVMFTPWRIYPAGQYKIIFRLKGRPTDREKAKILGWLQVLSYPEKILATKALTTKNLSSNYQDYQMNFNLAVSIGLRFQLLYQEGELALDYLYLTYQDQKDPEYFYKAEELFTLGDTVTDLTSSGRSAVTSGPGLNNNFIFGPFRRYPAGHYQVGFRVKAQRPSAEPQGLLKVSLANNRVISSQTLTDLTINYKTYWLDFTLKQPLVLEFQVEAPRTVQIFVDSLQIRKLK